VTAESIVATITAASSKLRVLCNTAVPQVKMKAAVPVGPSGPRRSMRPALLDPLPFATSDRLASPLQRLDFSKIRNRYVRAPSCPSDTEITIASPPNKTHLLGRHHWYAARSGYHAGEAT
jgi:hypothetical protein